MPVCLTHACVRFQVQLEPLIKSQRSKYTGIGQALVTIFKEEGVQVFGGREGGIGGRGPMLPAAMSSDPSAGTQSCSASAPPPPC